MLVGMSKLCLIVDTIPNGMSLLLGLGYVRSCLSTVSFSLLRLLLVFFGRAAADRKTVVALPSQKSTSATWQLAAQLVARGSHSVGSQLAPTNQPTHFISNAKRAAALLQP